MLDKLNQPKGSTIGVLRDGRSIQEAFDEIPSLLSFSGSTPTEKLKAAIAAGISEITIPPVEENGGKPYEFGEVVIPYPLRIVGKGSQGINTSKGTVIKRSAGAAFMFHFSGEGQAQRPMGGGLFNINCNGDSATATGDIIKVTQWSYFKAQNCSFQNMAGWGIRLKDVMESNITENLFRRLGGPNGGGIIFDDYRDAVTDNVNNLHISMNTFAFMSGPWIGSTAKSNPDLIWITNNKFEFDGTPAAPNTADSYVLNFEQIGRAYITDNGFTHFTTERNKYVGILRTGSTSLGSVMFVDNLMFACEGAGLIEGGVVISRGNISNQGSAANAIKQFTNNSKKACHLEQIVNLQSNGNVSVGRKVLPHSYLHMTELPGNTRQDFTPDSDGELGSVIKVPANTQARQWSVPKTYQDGKTIIKVTVRVKATGDGSSPKIVLAHGSTNLKEWTVTKDSWNNYTYFIKANVKPATLQLRNSGDTMLLVDGVMFERVDYMDWEFSFTPGTLAVGAKYTSPTQTHSDVLGAAISSVGMPMFDNVSTGLQCWVETVSSSGAFAVCVKNDSSASVASTISRCRIRVFIK